MADDRLAAKGARAAGGGSRPLAGVKLEGAGNDFIVIVAPAAALDPAVVRALCDRHFGIGADGVIAVSPGVGGTDLVMELRNADGSAAEMSGNGIRCLAKAAVDAGLVVGPSFTVATDAGVRTVQFSPSAQQGRARAGVDMGAVVLGDEVPAPAGALKARLVDVGNPHVVLLVENPSGVDVTAVGAALQAEHPDGVNVEFIAPVGDGELTLRVFERGVGETLACGTGSCAAAAAANGWGLVGGRVRVHNPGGALDVDLGDGSSVELWGPVRKVADVTVDLDSIL